MNEYEYEESQRIASELQNENIPSEVLAEEEDLSHGKARDNIWEDTVYAPNGKLSNLSKEDYEYTRSEAFKRIVGDWESARIVRQARNAWYNKKSINRTNFVPSDRFVSAVEDLTGNQIRLVVITDDSIRHIKSKHGSGEELRGQYNITPEDIATIPYIINNFDSITRSPEYDDKQGQFAITVTKRINGYSYIGTINRGKRNQLVVSTWRRKTSAALDASVKDTPGLNVRDDTDLVAKVKKDIEKIKHSAENVYIPFDENGEPTVETVEIVRRIEALELIAAQEENRDLFEHDVQAKSKVTLIEKEISGLKQKIMAKHQKKNILQPDTKEEVEKRKGQPISNAFYDNFRQTMYGSEIVSVQRTESPDYFLVYYNSNESDVGLGMVPEKYPILTDSLGNRLAFDRIQRAADASANHFFVLDDKIVAVGPSNNPNEVKPIVEIKRDAKLYDTLFLSADTDTQAKMLRGYVDASTSYEVLSYTSGGWGYDGEKSVLDAVNAFESGAPEADKLLPKTFSDLNLIEKEYVFHFALSERTITVEELRELTKSEDFIKATSTEEKTIPDTAFESPEDMLQWMKIVETKNLLGIPDSPGKNALESIYESALLMAEVEGKRTVEEMKDTFLSVAKQCRIGITTGPEQEFSLQDKLEAAYKRGIIDINDTLLIKSNYTGEYGIVQVEAISDKLTDGKKRIIIEAFPIEECPVLTVDSKHNIRKAEYRGADDPRPTYNYSEDGSLLSISMKNSSTYSLSDAIKDMSEELTPELKEMNYLELSGLYETLIETSSALIGVEQCGFSKEAAEASKAELQTLMLDVHSEREAAKEELLNYMKWEKKTKTFFGRIFTGPFKHSRDIPQPEVLASLSVEDIEHDSIPKSMVVNFAEEYAKKVCLNLFPSTKPSREHYVALQTRIVNENDISQMPQHFHRQLEVAGRIDGTIVADGENVVVQRDGDKLISLRPDDIYSSISAQIQRDGNEQFVEIDDKKYSLNDRLITAIAYGNGQYLGSTNEDRLYVVYDIKQQKLVKAEPFEKLNREHCARKAETNQAKTQSEGLSKAKEQGKGKGRGGR